MRWIRDIGRLAKVSHWIATDLGWLIAVSARGGRTSDHLDMEARVALGLAAFGHVLHGGDAARIDAVLRERQTGHFALSRSRTPFEHVDPLESLRPRP